MLFTVILLHYIRINNKFNIYFAYTYTIHRFDLSEQITKSQFRKVNRSISKGVKCKYHSFPQGTILEFSIILCGLIFINSLFLAGKVYRYCKQFFFLEDSYFWSLSLGNYLSNVESIFVIHLKLNRWFY